MRTNKTTRDGKVVTSTEQFTTVELVSGNQISETSTRNERSSPARPRFKLSLPRFPFFATNRQQQHQQAPAVEPSKTSLTNLPSPKLTDLRKELLQLHNQKRKHHNASNLSLSDNLNTLAQAWAERLAATQCLQHRPNSGYGENVGYCSSGASQVVENWYLECKRYDYAKPSTNCGHFTQIVWKGSEEVGFGLATSKDGDCVYVVANYNPPGNVMGQYKQNVHPPRGFF